MLDFEVTVKGFDETIQGLKGYDQVAAQENRKAMNQTVKLVERVGKINAPVNFGVLRAKIHGEVREAGPGMVIGVVGSYAEHGAPVEKGTDPHWPNLKSLGLWVQRKLRVASKDVQNVTFLIARAISRRGTKAQPYLEPAIEDSQDEIKGFFQQALERIVERLARK